jgi:hypothetical protein
MNPLGYRWTTFYILAFMAMLYYTNWKVWVFIYIFSALIQMILYIEWAVNHRHDTEKFYSWWWYVKDCFIPVLNTLAVLVSAACLIIHHFNLDKVKDPADQ